MREALQKLQISAHENFDFLIARAWSVRGLREKRSVSRSSILYAAATIQPLVLALLETNGLNVAAWERSLGFASKPTFGNDEEPDMNFAVGSDTSAVLEQYRSRWPNRPLDALGLATVILKSASDGRHLAGMNLNEAIDRAEAFTNASPSGEFIDPVSLGFVFSDRTNAIFRKAVNDAQTSFPALTSSEAFVAAATLDEDGDDPTGPHFLRTFVETAVNIEKRTAIINEWMRWYGNDGLSSVIYWTQPLTAIVERSRVLAQEIRSRKDSPVSAIAARHFIGALIASYRWAANSGISDLLKKLEIDPQFLAQRYFAYLENAPAPSGQDDLSLWRRFLGLSDQSYVPRFDAETLGGADLLQISSDVDAFASLLASTRIAPPLSIGLFGDWGSGKSFFMARMRAEIAERAERTARTGDGVFLQRIVQIDFNAWHYVEANLWASLVEHLFRNLKLTYEKPTDVKIAERRNELLQKLDGLMAQRVDAEKKVQQAEIERDRTAQNLDASQKAAEASAAVVQGMKAKDVWNLVTVDSDTRQQLQAGLAQVGVNAALKSNDDLRKTVDDLRGAGTRIKLLLTWITRQPRMLVLLLVLLTLIPVGVGAALKFIQTFQMSVAAFLAAFVTYAGVVTNFVAKHLKTGKAILDTIDGARMKIDEKIQKAEIDRQTAIDDAGTALTKATAEVTQAKAELETRENDVAAAKNDLLELTNGYRLTRFIDERAASDDYRKLLGVLATVRNDFSTLSDLMHPADGKYDGADSLRIDRIILYIDDLDRCAPERVVEVLQAVHLLLAFKLFVVVVGVDARWVSESLRQKHKALRRRNDEDDERSGDADDIPGYAVAPHDYLEKIFQVPFWLEPLQATTTSSYLRSLLAGDVTKLRSAPLENIRTGPAADGTEGEIAPRPEASNTMAATDETDTDPKQLTIDTKERDYMTSEAIARLVGRSPRTAKRYVNTYRFFRARMANERLDEYLADTDPPQYRCALLLLAIVVGAPDVSLEIFAKMKENDAASVAAFAESMKTDDEHAVQWLSVKAALTAFEKGKTPLAKLLTHLPRVIRYSFRAPYAQAIEKKVREPRKVYMVPIREEPARPSPVI
jgi:hypothetical protein